jgi:hypothetical protein
MTRARGLLALRGYPLGAASCLLDLAVVDRAKTLDLLPAQYPTTVPSTILKYLYVNTIVLISYVYIDQAASMSTTSA